MTRCSAWFVMATVLAACGSEDMLVGDKTDAGTGGSTASGGSSASGATAGTSGGGSGGAAANGAVGGAGGTTGGAGGTTGGAGGTTGGAGGTTGGAGGAGGSGMGGTGSNCGCVIGAYIPKCGVDGMTYDAACGIECVPVSIACDGFCPCGGTGGTGGEACPEGDCGGASGPECTCLQDGQCVPATGPLGSGTCRSANGTCFLCDCASPDTPIATPSGERPLAELRVGDLVYSVDRNQIRAVPIRSVNRVPVSNHRVLRVAFTNGAQIEMSAGHPLADGRPLSALQTGAELMGGTVAAVTLVPYRHPFTYDILPDSETGTYFASGVLVGSTLQRAAAASPASRP